MRNIFKCIFSLKAVCDSRDFFWTNLNLLVLRMNYAKYQCIQACGSWDDEDF